MITLSNTILFLWVWSVLITVIFYLYYKKASTWQTQLQLAQENKDKKTKQKTALGPLLDANKQTLTLHVDGQGKILYADDDLFNLTKFSKKELIGKNVYGTLMPTLSPKKVLEKNLFKRIFANPKLYTEHETEFYTKTGEKVWITWTNKIVYNQKKKPVELRSVGFDITARKNLEAELQCLASTDPQTGVLNKIALLEIGTRELKRSIRYHHDFSVLALRIFLVDDIDQQIGDSVLQKVVGLCRQVARDVDYLGRIWENEFCLLLPETPVQNVVFLQKRLQEKLDAYNQQAKPSEHIRIEYGYTGYTQKDTSIDALIVKAIQNIKPKKAKR